MRIAPLPPDEAARLALLSALNILDSAPEESFDRITRLASRLLGAPMALVSLLDERRQWAKSSVGCELLEVPRSLAFCAYVIQQRETLVVPDLRLDERFADNPLVAAEPHLRFYAGAPLLSAEGVALGTLCILDHQPRELQPHEGELLHDLAALVSREMVVREMALRAQGALLFQLQVPAQGPVRFTYACEGIAAMAGVSLGALLDDAEVFLSRVHPDDRRQVSALLRQPPAEASARASFRLSDARRQSIVWCEARANAHFSESGAVLWSGCLSDVTEQVELERQRRDNERLWATTVLAGGMAHDFNNLLGSMMGLAEICREQCEPGSRMHRNLQAIMDGGHKATLLIRRLLDYARQSDLVFEPTRLGVLSPGVAMLLKAALPAGVDLALEVGVDEPVAADRGQLEQVLLNLVSNAGHAMKGRGGTVRLVVQAAPAAHSPLHKRSMRLQVIDTGCGIAPEDLPNVFQPFFTTKPVGEGSGLGLSSAYGIVTAHGGLIEARSVPGEGSTFNVWLPCLEAGAAIVSPVRSAPAAPTPFSV